MGKLQGYADKIQDTWLKTKNDGRSAAKAGNAMNAVESVEIIEEPHLSRRRVRLRDPYGQVMAEFMEAEQRKLEPEAREVYTDYDGRTFIKPKNAIKPTVHQSGHFPIGWMIEASERASESEILVKIEVAKNGVVVVAHDGDDYEQHELPWTMMDKAEVNPIIPAIEGLEKKLRVLRSAKSKMKAKAA